MPEVPADDKAPKKDATPSASTIAKLYKRGTVTCSVPILSLWMVSKHLGLGLWCTVAFCMQLAVFLAHGLPANSEKFYDLSGSFTHLALVLTCLFAEQRERSARQLFVAVASTMWMTRLGTFLYSRILRDGKDERFDAIKQLWLSFLGAWLLQALWVTLIQLPVVLINNVDDPAARAGLGALDVFGMALWFGGFLFEAAADSEKLAFRSKPENRHRFITTGLWSLSRHPNYFGEIVMWSALSLICSSAALDGAGGAYLHAGWISPAFSALLLLKVSGVPMVEKAGEKKWGAEPEYQAYMANTPCVVPAWPSATAQKSKTK